MSDYNDFSLDDILAEFSAGPATQEPDAPADASAPAPGLQATTVFRSTPAPEPAAAPVPGKAETGAAAAESSAKAAAATPPGFSAKETAPAKKTSKRSLGFVRILAALLMAVLSLGIFPCLPLLVHPDADSAADTASTTRLDLTAKADIYANNMAADVLSSFEDAAYIRKHYTIDEAALSGPAPREECFGTTTDIPVVLAVIAESALLEDGEEFALTADTVLFPNSEIKYYSDETILMVAWKEKISGKCCTMVEVKVADGSQLRRKIADDSYSSSVQLKATTMATQANAVVAVSGDFYAFRNLGITVYQRKVYRCNSARLDSCFFTAGGEMLFSHKGELGTIDEAQAFVDANDVVFGVAFGPILVENGEKQTITSYPIGEIDKTYSRTAIGTRGDLHYFIMTVNYQDDCVVAATLAQLAQFVYDKGCIQAYALDGGQTSTVVIQGETFNRVDWNNERTMSDIIYFATALPEEEVGA